MGSEMCIRDRFSSLEKVSLEGNRISDDGIAMLRASWLGFDSELSAQESGGEESAQESEEEGSGQESEEEA